MKKILLIVPQFVKSTNLVKFHEHEFINRKSFASPLAMATLASLTPDEFSTEIWDENVKGLISDVTGKQFDYDLVAVTGFITHIRRQKELAAFFREKGITVVAGGVGVSSAPEKYRDYFDVLFIGECENIWQNFLNDFISGTFKREYIEDCFVELSRSPMPKWDSIAENIKQSYVVGTVQSTRGCPYSCEFCTIWSNFGRKVRTKDISQVIKEITKLYQIGFREILFANDNFAGNMKYSKELLRAMIKLNSELPEKIRYFAEISVNIAREDEFLELLAEANFRHLLMGIETPNIESLKETHKGQNLTNDLESDCKKIMSYGMAIEGSMIIGFDNDTTDIFDIQFDFIQKTCFPIVKMHLLKANPGSALIKRLEAEGRIIKELDVYDENCDLDPDSITNIIPKRMSRYEMLDGYVKLLERLNSWENYFKRLEGFILGIKNKRLVKEYDDSEIELGMELTKIVDSIDYRAAEKAAELLKLTLKRIPDAINDIATLIIRHQLELARIPKLITDVRKIMESEL